MLLPQALRQTRPALSSLRRQHAHFYLQAFSCPHGFSPTHYSLFKPSLNTNTAIPTACPGCSLLSVSRVHDLPPFLSRLRKVPPCPPFLPKGYGEVNPMPPVPVRERSWDWTLAGPPSQNPITPHAALLNRPGPGPGISVLPQHSAPWADHLFSVIVQILLPQLGALIWARRICAISPVVSGMQEALSVFSITFHYHLAPRSLQILYCFVMPIKIKGQIPHVGVGLAFSAPWYLAFPVKQVSVCFLKAAILIGGSPQWGRE